MLQQLDYALTTQAFFTSSGVGVAGLTVTVDVRKPDGTLIVTDAAATEFGGGFYGYTLPSTHVDAMGIYTFLFKTTGSVDVKQMPATWVCGLDWIDYIESTYAALGSAVVALTAPVALDGDATIIRGDDYAALDGRSLRWTDSGGSWPDLTGATLVFTFLDGTSPLPMSIIDAGSANQTAELELTAAQSTALEKRLYDIRIVATLASTRVVTLVRAELVVEECL